MIDTIIEECDGLIYSIASQYKNNYNIEDLYQAGCIGVMKAYKNFNGNLNVKFSSYAYKYIVGEMIDYIRKDRNIKVSNEYYDVYKRYEKTKNLLRNRFCREPKFQEICEFMGLNEQELLCIIESTAFTKSIEQEEMIESYVSEDDKLINRLALDAELENIEEPAKSIIKYRYYYGMSQQETASIMELSQSRISREESHALKRIKSKIVA